MTTARERFDEVLKEYQRIRLEAKAHDHAVWSGRFFDDEGKLIESAPLEALKKQAAFDDELARLSRELAAIVNGTDGDE